MLRYFRLAKFLLAATALLALCAEPAFAARGGGGGGGGSRGGGGGGGYRGGGMRSYASPGAGSYTRSYAAPAYSQGNSARSNQSQLGSREFNSGFNGSGQEFAGARNNWNNYYNGRGEGGWAYGRNNWNYGGWGWGAIGFLPYLGGWGWDGGYPYGGYGYYYPQDDIDYYSYGPSYGAAGGDAVVDAPSPPVNTTVATSTAEVPQADNDGAAYYAQARQSFMDGDYRQALRYAEHAAVESPNNPKIHELISLSLFSMGKYQAAASEAHATAAMAALTTWDDLYAYYGNVDTYTKQLRALETASRAHPDSAAEHFLLGYHYLITGARDNAKAELAAAVKLTPKDKLASHYSNELQANAPLTPPEIAARPGSAAR